MAVIAEFEKWGVIKWPECDTPDMKALFSKLFKYKKKAGFRTDGLDLTKRDREIIKQIYNCFDWAKEEKPEIAEHSNTLTEVKDDDE